MKKIFLLLSINFTAFNFVSYSQVKQELLEPSVETIVNLPQKGKWEFAGYFKDSIILCMEQENYYQFYLLDENSYTLNPVFQHIKIGIMPYISYFSIMDSVIFYFRSQRNSSEDGYSQLYIRYGSKKEKMLDSISNFDKKIHSSYSYDKKYLIVNSLNKLPDYYIPEQDNQFIFYDITHIQTSIINRMTIPCTCCSKGYLINNNFFFTKSNERDDLWGGYAWTDMYLAKWPILQDTVRIATRSNILAISPNGKYILIERQDMINSTCAILDVENKRYQLLLGRDYRKYNFFYSYKKNKFSYVIKDKIIYVDFPHRYPFNAIEKEDKNILQLLMNFRFSHQQLE
jgi:hypothetical protein